MYLSSRKKDSTILTQADHDEINDLLEGIDQEFKERVHAMKTDDLLNSNGIKTLN